MKDLIITPRGTFRVNPPAQYGENWAVAKFTGQRFETLDPQDLKRATRLDRSCAIEMWRNANREVQP
jgi:hypothetical protein